MGNGSRFILVSALTGAVTLPIGFGVQAAEGADGAPVLEEVVVTARKREEALQDVPVSVQAFTADDINRFTTDSLTELAELATMVELTPAAYGGGVFVVRGQGGNNVSNPGLDSAVGINVDGVQIDRGHITRHAFFDLEAMQVLKGPQGVYFGKNSTAGLIVVSSASPTDEFEAGLKGGYEWEADEKYVEGFLSGPLTDRLLARLAFRANDSRGWLKNDAPPVAHSGEWLPEEPYDFPGAPSKYQGASETQAFRLTLDWQATESLDAVFKLTTSNQDNEGAIDGQLIRCSMNTPATRVTTGLLTNFASVVLQQPTGDCKLDDRVTLGAVPVEVARAIPGGGDGTPYANYDGLLGTLNLRLEQGWYTITAVTGYYQYDWERNDNFDYTTFNQLFGPAEEDHEVWSQEIRLDTALDGPVDFMVGAYYESYERDFGQHTKLFAMGPDPVTGFAHNASSFSTVESDSMAVFGEIVWRFSDTWDLSVGTRYTDDDRSAEQGHSYVHPTVSLFNFFLPEGVVLESEFEDSNLSSEVTLSWHPTEQVMVYAAYREGYKAGGFSTPSVIDITKTGAIMTFEPEEVDGYELGLKSLWLDRRFQVNATVFDYDYQGMQVNAFDARTSSFTIVNAASSATKGVEIESQYLVTPNLTLRGAVAFNEADFEVFRNAPCYNGQTDAQGCVGGFQDLSGEDQNTPDVETQLGFDYAKQVSEGLVFDFSYTALFTDEYDLVRLQGIEQDSFWRHNLSIGLADADGTWGLYLKGRNVTDEIYARAGNFGCGDKPGAVVPGADTACGTGRGREFYAEANYRF
jgi:outer membrane receptor protein involved in Fe transport